jgi:hypothetical protein
MRLSISPARAFANVPRKGADAKLGRAYIPVVPNLKLAAAAVLVGGLAASSFAGAYVTATQTCVPPRGPGDQARHSVNLRVTNIGCEAGRRVALACARYSYGHSGGCIAVGYRWRCMSTKPLGLASSEKCLSGRRVMSITWTD